MGTHADFPFKCWRFDDAYDNDGGFLTSGDPSRGEWAEEGTTTAYTSTQPDGVVWHYQYTTAVASIVEDDGVERFWVEDVTVTYREVNGEHDDSSEELDYGEGSVLFYDTLKAAQSAATGLRASDRAFVESDLNREEVPA